MSKSAPKPDVQAMMDRLCEPFDLKELKYKPAVVSGNRAMAIFYVDARVVQDRLDDVLGVVNWQDTYKVLADGCVACRLRLRLGDEWITKMDVGSESEQGDAGDRRKAAFSDALKRAAVKFGIGRYLYRLPAQWLDFDPHKKQFTQRPTLPNFAKPGSPSPASPQAPPQASSPPTAAPVSGSLTEEERKWLAERCKGRSEWATALLGVFGCQRAGELQRRCWPLFKLAVERQATPDWLAKDILQGKRVADLSEADLDYAAKELQERTNRGRRAS